MASVRPLQGADAVRAENAWRVKVGLQPYAITRQVIERLERRNNREAIEKLRRSR